MQAIIMAGGKGTRLRNITRDAIPKALVKTQNKTLLDCVVEHAIKNGCNNIIICTGHLGHKIREHIEKKKYNVTIHVSQEKEPLGTAGALHLVKDLLDDEFVILYADIYTTINIKRMFQFHKKRNSDVTIAVHTSDHPQDSTIVKIDKNGKILEMIEKPGDKWIKYGNLTQTSLYIVKKGVMDFIQKNEELDLAKDIFPLMRKKGKLLYAYYTEEYAKDVGTPERYQKVINHLKT